MGTPAPGSVPEACIDDAGEEMDSKKCATALLDQGANNAAASVFSAFVIPSGGYVAADCTGYETVGSDMDKYCQAYFLLEYEGTINDRNGQEGMKSIILDECTEDEPKYEYYILFSTAGIAAMIFFFITYCIELGKRAGKLAILQLLAPIPVLMEIVPGKSGSRKKWLDMTISTYLDVFVYQVTIFIVIYMITFVPGALKQLFSSATDGGNLDVRIAKNFSFIFIVFGLLKFGKDVPKMIEDLLPFKGGGSLSNAFKNFKTIGGATAYAGGLVGGTIGRAWRNGREEFGKQDWHTGKGFAKGIWSVGKSAVGGAGSGLGRSLWGIKDVNSWKDANAQRRRINEQVSARKAQRDEYARAHQGRFGAKGGHISDILGDVRSAGSRFIGSKPGYEANEARLKSHQKFADIFKNISVDPNTDKKYNDFQKKYDDFLIKNKIDPSRFAEDFKEWKKVNKNGDLSQFILAAKNADGTFKYDNLVGHKNVVKVHKDGTTSSEIQDFVKDIGDLLENQGYMEGRERAMILDQAKNLEKALADMKALNDTDYEMASLYKEKGLDISSLFDEVSKGGLSNDRLYAIHKEISAFDKARKELDKQLNIQNAYEKAVAASKNSGKKPSGNNK